MDGAEFLQYVDHTLLKVDATWEQVQALCDEALLYKTASVCISPCHVARAAAYLGGKVKVCTVIGFPSGCSSTAVKVYETADAVQNGADEIDMVINVGQLKAGNTEYVLNEMRQVRRACPGKILKVIIEACLLTEAEKLTMCRLVTEAGADFIKTSTGFSTGGATFDDVALLKANVGPGVQVKAAGGISSLEDARKFLELGATRLGTSRIVKLLSARKE
ncbi:MAG: deoxyribose-phosphate aldolase [Treponema sp.]|nr:deoxyribose-phosphate aldolase [Treponema sp.]